MRRACAGPALLLGLACGCAGGPQAAFDAGHEVHVILKAHDIPAKGLGVRPTCTLGSRAASLPRTMLRRDGLRAVEAAQFRAPNGKWRLAVWEPRTRVEARMDLDVERELWVVLDLHPGVLRGSLRVYDSPPHEAIGAWRPLVAVPD